MKSVVLILSFLLIISEVHAQYAPQATVSGSTAIQNSDNSIVGWAKSCTIERGYMDIADKAKGKVTLGDPSYAVGNADNFIVSLGDSGVAVLTFSSPIYNGPGADFAVFENGFSNPNDPEEAFLELAFVEVSSDGINYTRFPASSNTGAPQVPGSGVYMNARKINNLAGKYMTGWGTPFDLQELVGTAGLDVNSITHVRIVDVIGDIGANGSKDKDGNVINDPYPTAFASGGFDLDGVGVMNMAGVFPNAIASVTAKQYHIYPNPTNGMISITASDNQLDGANFIILDVAGKVLEKGVLKEARNQINLTSYSPGIYNIILKSKKGDQWVEKITKL
ncbi:MAG: T9SS type A sorting domain-containing protein [Flavipsychrobacter sp.]